MTDVPAGFRRDWHRLWHLAEQVAGATSGEPGSVFEPVGLLLERPDKPNRGGGYRVSPANAAMFASTGGDGVHFSALYASEASGTAPVVMTVPMQFDHPNYIVGASMPEFLALGCVTGFFCLEQLAYDWGRGGVVNRLQAHRTPSSPEEEFLLRALVEEFQLQPWPDVAARLHDFDTQHSGDIVLEENGPR
jgi:hypothetical protein